MNTNKFDCRAIKFLGAGIRGDLYRWFESYIDNRSQAVVINNYMSSWVEVPSGVPQGSLLGPLLFLIYISDIDNCFHHSKALIFADDMKIVKEISSANDCVALQEDLDRLDHYCSINKLDLNPSKCSFITFTRKRLPITSTYYLKGQSLRREHKVRDLGIIHDSKLLFDEHVDYIVKKALKSLGFIMRLSREFKHVKSFKILYCTYVRSILEYASEIWNPRYNIYISRIERIQRKFVRYLNYRTFNKELNKDYISACKKYHLLPLSTRRDISDLMFLLKIFSNKVDCPELISKFQLYVPNRSRRYTPTFVLSNTSSNYRQNSYIWRASNLFNKMANEHSFDIFCMSKHNLKKSLSEKFFLS